jgi:hypothetical protein
MATLAAKGVDFLGGITATQGACRQKIQGQVRILLSACQLGNERLMRCVQPT